MPVESILYLALVVGAMITFASALAYGERVSGRVPETPSSPLAAERSSAPSPADITTYKKAA